MYSCCFAPGGLQAAYGESNHNINKLFIIVSIMLPYKAVLMYIGYIILSGDLQDEGFYIGFELLD